MGFVRVNPFTGTRTSLDDKNKMCFCTRKDGKLPLEPSHRKDRNHTAPSPPPKEAKRPHEPEFFYILVDMKHVIVVTGIFTTQWQALASLVFSRTRAQHSNATRGGTSTQFSTLSTAICTFLWYQAHRTSWPVRTAHCVIAKKINR